MRRCGVINCVVKAIIARRPSDVMVSLMKGRFITLEGSEGVGKTTNMQFIKSCLEQLGIECVVTREPGGTSLGEKIRALLLDRDSESIDDYAELLLIFAARAQHLARIIKPALVRGVWVLCDRFTDATYAYQGGGRGVPDESITVLENLLQGDLRPDLTIILDIDPEIGLARVKERGEFDRFEQEQLHFFQRVRSAYLARAAADTQRYRVVNVTRTLTEIQSDLRQELDHFIQRVQ